jgi:predicted Rossmann fold flavoprotein
MKIAIIGAGAAGCFTAANIHPRAGQEVVVFEKTGKALQKVKVSGGGRCNVTHHLFDVPELLTRYPRGKQLLRKSLYRFTPMNTIAWFESRGMRIKAEPDGRMFPITDDSQSIIDTIWQQMMQNKVDVQYHKSIERIEKKDSAFALYFADKNTREVDKVVVACGGFPKPEQYHWIRALGHTINEPVPSLFTFNIPKHPITELMGVSVPDVSIKIMDTKIAERGPVLITHWGLSGPVVLRSSAWGARVLNALNYDFKIQVNWLADVKELELRERIGDLRKEIGKQYIQHKNPFELPRRLWEYLLQRCDIGEEVRWGELPAAGQNKLVENLIRDVYPVKGKTTFKEEFVTSGGVQLSEIDPQTLESRVVPGLYFAGEIIDADGITGGFNFQHAWSSAYIVAQSVRSER